MSRYPAAMIQSAYFISDLHLDIDDPVNYRAFFHFLQHTAPKAEALYILGDLFDFWIGDDDLRTPFHQQITQALSALVSQGTQLYYMHGNRDFLPGPRFARACGLRLLPDPTTVMIAGRPLLLSHGDLLCTKDKGYLTLRAIVHHPVVQCLFLALPKVWRRRIARHIQGKSRHQSRSKTPYLMDVTEDVVYQWMQQKQTPVMIHGHTHHPAKHIYANGHIRWVLPDWSHGLGGYLYIDAENAALMTLTHQPFPLPSPSARNDMA